MKKLLSVIVLGLALSGCAEITRKVANLHGYQGDAMPCASGATEPEKCVSRLK